ncbi:MAG: NADH:ubiquinone reductase (Na(+)-transporting) subunit A, partial [Pseudomonadota bacterium]|nr:NADH:ubiquinone reductase (Na(+)-transporting) subunit A [Pseudomonadota bacterium]
DKKNPGVIFTSPGGGIVESINRGEKRTLQSVVIEISDNEEEISFSSIKTYNLNNHTKSSIRENLIKSGLWTSFRTRPFSKIPTINSDPKSIFINCMDTNPLSLDPELIISNNLDNFELGLSAIRLLSGSPLHLCIKQDSSLTFKQEENTHEHIFYGPHPSGLAGTHMHFISPATIDNINWHISYSDVILIGSFFSEGKIPTNKYICLSGPKIENPRIISTRIGACIDEICAGELSQSENRVVSGSLINGREAIGSYAYIGKYHNQICAIEEPNSSDRELFDWALLGRNRFSKLGIFISSLLKNKEFNIKARMYGPDRAILPLGVYEEVFPLNLLITPLLRALAVGDTQELQSLGILELDEEDLALCSFVCPSKYDFSYLLRERLNAIEVEG